MDQWYQHVFSSYHHLICQFHHTVPHENSAVAKTKIARSSNVNQCRRQTRPLPAVMTGLDLGHRLVLPWLSNSSTLSRELGISSCALEHDFYLLL